MLPPRRHRNAARYGKTDNQQMTRSAPQVQNRSTPVREDARPVHRRNRQTYRPHAAGHPSRRLWALAALLALCALLIAILRGI